MEKIRICYVENKNRSKICILFFLRKKYITNKEIYMYRYRSEQVHVETVHLVDSGEDQGVIDL